VHKQGAFGIMKAGPKLDEASSSASCNSKISETWTNRGYWFN